MEFSYSPQHSTGGTLHLPSPTHPHAYSIDGFSTIHKLRRSMSKSPSKPQRHNIYSHHSPAGPHRASLSSLGLANRISPRATEGVDGRHSSGSIFDSCHSSPAKKPRFPVKRTPPLRNASRTKSTPSSPMRSPMRRVLSDTGTQGNCLPVQAQDCFGNAEDLERLSKTDVKGHGYKLGLNDGPIKFDFSKTLQENAVPVKSSPLKRGDGLLNLDTEGTFGSPVAKRRSLHGGDFESLKSAMMIEGVFDSGEADRDSDRQVQQSQINKNSPLRRSLSLRKSTLQQRHTPGQPKPHAPEFLLPTVAASKTRQRFSLDGSFRIEPDRTPSPFRRSTGGSGASIFSQHTAMPHRPSPSSKQPHPLATALSPSSSVSSLDDASDHASGTTFSHSVRFDAQPTRPPGFSKSLPLNAMRPTLQRKQGSLFHGGDDMSGPSPFSTPEANKPPRPMPAAFMSTGLISKKNRNAELLTNDSAVQYVMPDTPSKRVSFPPMTATPFRKSVINSPAGDINHETSPKSPFGFPQRKDSRGPYSQSVSLFGSRIKASSLVRKASFASLTGDEDSHSPSNQIESQSSNDEFPPTPTKPSEGRRSKENSLRSSLFGRRTSLTADTFVPPTMVEDGSASVVNVASSSNQHETNQCSPITPQDSVTPPDPSRLSISGKPAAADLFKLSTSSNVSFPPATPTTSREYQFPFTEIKAVHVAGVPRNDIDTELTARFGTVVTYGSGEFSQVYRVEDPHKAVIDGPAHSFSNLGKVWAVKKSKRPFLGLKDKERKLQEVYALQNLRGHEHIVQYSDSWEANGHLYIQTEFCENGNLKDFLAHTGFKARLDDFRIWKIMLELSAGLKHIHGNDFVHLDLKPANVFIDWEGVLKIGDFGLASPWPAPQHIDGEGDREYIAPEILVGKFDKPADVFALGMMMLEIAGNIILPDNGTSWQRLRAGDLSDLPSLTWSDSSLSRDEAGDPIESLPNRSQDALCGADDEDDGFKFQRETSPTPGRRGILTSPPPFMTDAEHHEALDKVVQWMICPEPSGRPVVDQLCRLGPVTWVERRRRAGATIYEGNYGPADDVLSHNQDVDMTDAI